MASGSSKRGGGDRVLESRHLFGLFLGVVLLCCVFFTLGYVMGKTQYGNAPVQAASVEKAPPVAAHETQTAAQSQASPEWDFYAKKKSVEVPLKPVPASRRSAEPTAASSSISSLGRVSPAPVRHESTPIATHLASETPARFRPPHISRNAVVLQVGALRSESDALAMADALQQKGFPAFVITPSTDSFYRVQVGPFASQTIGDKAKQSLQRAGFKAIFRR